MGITEPMKLYTHGARTRTPAFTGNVLFWLSLRISPTFFALFAQGRYFRRPSICTISASPSPTAANTHFPSDDQKTRRAMNVRFWPKSVIRLNFPSAVDATQRLVPCPSSKGKTSHLPSLAITGCRPCQMGTRSPEPVRGKGNGLSIRRPDRNAHAGQQLLR